MGAGDRTQTSIRQGPLIRSGPLLGRVLDAWFAPKSFESTALYESLGVLLIKRYVPTGGDFVRRRYRIRIFDIRGNPESLMRFERNTRELEAIHVAAFLGFLAWSVWRAISHRIPLVDLGVAILAYTVLILSPAMLQRYHRLRVYAVIQRMLARDPRDRDRRQRPGGERNRPDRERAD